jgi:nucleotide-binding universal stress UspA family protein
MYAGKSGALYYRVPMHRVASSLQLKLDNVAIATDFSPASKRGILFATTIARRHNAKLFIVHVVTSRSEGALMDGWRAGQTELINNLVANRLDGIQHELIVKSGDIWDELSKVIAERGIDLVVVGTRGRTGVSKFILGSVAEKIFRRAPCPVLTVGPNIEGQDPEVAPERILAPTAFAAHSVHAVHYAIGLAQELHSKIALLNVVTEIPDGASRDRLRDERLARIRSLVPSQVRLPSEPEYFVEFGAAPEKILQTAASWNANLIVLGLHRADESSTPETTWAKAYEIVCKSTCPVLRVRGPE